MSESELIKLIKEKEDLEKLLSERNTFCGELQKNISINKLLNDTQDLIYNELQEQKLLFSTLVEKLDPGNQNNFSTEIKEDQLNSVSQGDANVDEKCEDEIRLLVQSLQEESNKIDNELLDGQRREVERAVDILNSDEFDTFNYTSLSQTSEDLEFPLAQVEQQIQTYKEEAQSVLDSYETCKLELSEKLKIIEAQEQTLKNYESKVNTLEINLIQTKNESSIAADQQVTLSKELKEKDQLVEKLQNSIKSMTEAQEAEQVELNATLESIMNANVIEKSEFLSHGEYQKSSTSLDIEMIFEMIAHKHADEIKAKNEEMAKLKQLKEEQLVADQLYEHQMEEEIESLQAQMLEKSSEIECLKQMVEEMKNLEDISQLNSDLLKMIEEKENEINLAKQNHGDLQKTNASLQAALDKLNHKYQQVHREQCEIFDLRSNLKIGVDRLDESDKQIKSLQNEISKKDAALRTLENKSNPVPDTETKKMQEKYKAMKLRLAKKIQENKDLKEMLGSKQSTINSIMALKSSSRSDGTSSNGFEL